ncbi:hypothetical protein DVR12_00095 [Chitinophaga silvatica]|uniref:DUF4304 domain-containing protein n=1 Tax=Chitinophaga silvatica TaxID=2282649 RepID=A0A3E1YFQ7_9BACT|nr:hypothetical protein [Chitinophaga silvatica]RFS26227.1 hypothetical protein DVR12_00095 [Chitinophaga silvatica]
MTISTEIKKAITHDWQNAIPELTEYSQNKLYNVVGPLVIGIELIKLPMSNEYRPHFVIYSLWKQDLNSCLDIPILLKEYHNKNGVQYSIPYENHNIFFNEAVDSVKNQTPLTFEGNISFGKVMSVLDEYSQMRPLSAAPNSFIQATLAEAKLKIALFIGISEAQNILEKINRRNWDVNHFKSCGVDVNNWLQSLQSSLSNRGEFLKQIEVNKHNKKISYLNSSELINQ